MTTILKLAAPVSPISRLLLVTAGLTCALVAAAHSPSPSEYYNHVFFDNSAQTGTYWYSSASAGAPSTLEQQDYHLPVETSTFHSPPNALRLAWQSKAGGGMMT